MTRTTFALRRRAASPAPRALALATAMALSSAAWSAATVTGPVSSSSSGTFAGGVGDFLLPGENLWVGLGDAGTLVLDGGSLLRAGGLFMAAATSGVPVGGVSSTLITGTGTAVQLDLTSGNRLGVGEWGTGQLTVSGGATLNGRVSACNGFCGSFIGNAAGSDGSFTVTGTGSSATLTNGFFVGNIAVFNPPNAGFTFGTPGGVSRGTVNVLDGGSLTTGNATLGAGPGGSSPLGTERSFASVTVSGIGSQWRVTNDGTGATNLALAAHANANATLAVTGGGLLRIEGPANQVNAMAVGAFGRADATVSGTGSALEFATGSNGVLQIGRNAGANGSLSVTNGGQVRGALYYTAVGRDGGTGVLTVDGAGSLYSMSGDTTLTDPAKAGGAFVAGIDVARNGATGTMNVRNGARVEVLATTARSNGPYINVGRDIGSTGTVTIAGAGTVVQLTAASTLPGGGAAEAFNPGVSVGRQGTGVLNLTAGAKLQLQGNAVSTVAASRSTVVNIGGIADSGGTLGGTGVALVSGAGTELTVAGSDPFLGVGRGAGAVGVLTVADSAVVRGQSMAVGRSGGMGTLTLNGGSIHLSGQQTGNNLAGANLAIGAGGGTGVVTMSNNALLRIDNAGGTVSSGVAIGGVFGASPGGQGVLSMSSGARIEVAGPAGLGGMSVGRDGSGVLTMSASSIDLGATGAFTVGRAAGSSGLVRMADASTITAQYVGVGRLRNADGSTAPGGAGTLIVNSGSVVNATTLEIGTAGYLGGVGTINANVVNYGTLNPGNSPGTMVINGGYTAGAGGKLVLEVESDGHGGFVTDQVIFGAGATVDLTGLVIDFKFLGATDPSAFKATGAFDVDTFLKQQVSDGHGGTTTQALADSAFAQVSFTAEAADYTITGFSYSAAGGVSDFTATAAVPEPGTWAMLAGGLALIAARRRRAAR